MKINATSYNYTNTPKTITFKSTLAVEKPVALNSANHQIKSDKISSIKPISVIKKDVISNRLKSLEPITFNEYMLMLDEISEYKGPFFYYDAETKKACNNLINYTGYEDIDEELKGIVPYCGKFDISDQINRWLTGRESEHTKYHFNNQRMINIINTLDYSLKRLDEKFGKYEGMIYRNGYFNPNESQQYYSATFLPESVLDIRANSIPSIKNKYSIIKIKNGHDVYKFQRYADSEVSNMFADDEHEILIDRKSKFRLIPEEEYTEEDKKLLSDFMTEIIKKFHSNSSQKELMLQSSKYNEFISIWEEV